MDLITQLFSGMGNIAGEVGSLMAKVFEAVVKIFYTAGAGESAGQLTFVGWLSLIGVVTSIFFFGFNYIRKLIKIKG